MLEKANNFRENSSIAKLSLSNKIYLRDNYSVFALITVTQITRDAMCQNLSDKTEPKK